MYILERWPFESCNSIRSILDFLQTCSVTTRRADVSVFPTIYSGRRADYVVVVWNTVGGMLTISSSNRMLLSANVRDCNSVDQLIALELALSRAVALSGAIPGSRSLEGS